MKALALALVILAMTASMMISDLFIKGRGLDGVNGIDAHSWDVYGTMIALVALLALVVHVVRDDRKS